MTTLNLLTETIAQIEESDHGVGDVAWVGSDDGRLALSWEEARPMLDVTYDAGFGGQEIASDLVVVFADGTWLERGEYNGSEWWEYRRVPQRQPESQPFGLVEGGLWQRLTGVNAEVG